MTINGITVQNYPLKRNLNVTTRGVKGIKWICIHYTAGETSASKAEYVVDYWNSGKTVGSADYVVDDDQIIQANPNPQKYYCNAVGGNSSQYQKVTSLSKQYLSVCHNSNSISIELCDMHKNGEYYFTEKTMANAAALCKYLMQVYGINESHVIMHHQVTGKQCPYMWTTSELALDGWYSWKRRIGGTIKNTTDAANKAATSATTSTSATQSNKSGTTATTITAVVTTANRDKAKSGKYTITASTLNLRYGPSSEKLSNGKDKYGVIMTLKKGVTVTNYGFYSGNWLFVSVTGRNGWVCADYLKKV